MTIQDEFEEFKLGVYSGETLPAEQELQLRAAFFGGAVVGATANRINPVAFALEMSQYLIEMRGRLKAGEKLK